MKRIRKKFLAVDPAFAEIKNEEAVGYRWARPSSDLISSNVRWGRKTSR
jgi:hypothetical protein